MSSSLTILQEEKRLPWYKEGLPFKCTECGKCCTGAPGVTWLTDEEAHAMADYLNIPLPTFLKRYTRQINYRLALLERPVSYDCIFLEGKGCSVYPVRPKQCRTFPWWPENLTSPEAWEETARDCEGISDAAPIVPLKEIKRHLPKEETERRS